MSVNGVTHGTDPGVALHRPGESDRSLVAMMKDVRKARLQREIYSRPELAGKLVALEASPVYNSKAELIQSTGLSL
ncbi:MAG: hypothetical protein AB1916_09070 [Thermodesulfobacteriota bacterium]